MKIFLKEVGARETKCQLLKNMLSTVQTDRGSVMLMTMAAALSWHMGDLREIVMERRNERCPSGEENSELLSILILTFSSFVFERIGYKIAHILRRDMEFSFSFWTFSCNFLFSRSVVELNSSIQQTDQCGDSLVHAFTSV